MKLRGLGALLAATALVAVSWTAKVRAEETSGPTAGSEAPLLHVDAFNDQGGSYCVTCRAGKLPALVAFVSKDDEATHKLIAAVDAAAKANAEKKLNAAVIILPGGDATALEQFVSAQKLSVPTALISGDNPDLPNWKLNGKVATTVSLISGHKVQQNLTNPSTDAVGAGVKTICG